MTNVRTLHDRIADAVEYGQIAEAVELAGEMNTASQSVSDLVGEFEAAMEDGDTAQARTIRQQIRGRLVKKQSEDERLVKQANAAIEAGGLGQEDQKNLRDVIQTAADTSRLRSGFLSLSGLYLARVDEVDELGELGTTSELLKDREQTLTEERQTVESTVQDVTVPAQLAFVGGATRPTVDVDDPEPLELPLHNVGDEPVTTAIDVTFTASEDLTVSPEPSSLPSLSPGEVRTVELQLVEVTAGDHQVTVRAIAQGGPEAAKTLTVTAEQLGGPNPLLQAFTGPDGTVRFQDVIEAIAHYNDQTPIPGTESKLLSFQEVLWVIERYNSGD